jgi:short-subunit dehydrogenase
MFSALLRTVEESAAGAACDRGQLVLVGSVAGHVACTGMSAYSMSKFAVRALAETLHGDLAPEGISVTLVSPGFVGFRHPSHRQPGRGAALGHGSDPGLAAGRYRGGGAEIVAASSGARAEVVVTGPRQAASFSLRGAFRAAAPALAGGSTRAGGAEGRLTPAQPGGRT